MGIIFERIITICIMTSVVSVFAAIIVDFQRFEEKKNVVKGRQSIVATGTMIGFVIVYFLILRLKIGAFGARHDIIIGIGTAMVMLGALFNIIGRLNLKGNWANHIKIYDDHVLITTGVYQFVRHPLYASIMLMLFGGCLVYRNWLCFLMTMVIFIPFMYYRAKQEEKLLDSVFPDYESYREKTGMFFPKLWR